LFHDARTVRPDTSRAEYGFETRLLARLPRETGTAGRLVRLHVGNSSPYSLQSSWRWGMDGRGTRFGVERSASAITGDHEDATLVSYLTGGSL